MNIVGFVKSLMPSLNKSEVEADIEVSLDTLDVIQGTWKGIEDIMKVNNFTSPKAKAVIKEFYKEFKKNKVKTKLSAMNNIGTDHVLLFGNVKLNGDYVYNRVAEVMNDTIVSSSISAYKANLLRAGAHLYFITRYALDLANYLFTAEVEAGGTEVDDDFLLNKKQQEFVEKNMWIYARLLSVYGDEHAVFKTHIEEIGDIVVNRDTANTVIDTYKASQVELAVAVPDNFIGSPFYGIRMVFAQWEADRYKNIKDKKRLLELRCLHLKALKEQGTSDVAIEKEINYLQKTITSMDYKLAKIERSVA